MQTQSENSKPEAESELMFEIRYRGERVSVAKSKLFDLALKGLVLPDDLITIGDTKVFADEIKGIVFGKKQPAAAPPSPAPVSKPNAPPEVGGDKSDPFNVRNEPTEIVPRVPRTEKSVLVEIGGALGTAINQAKPSVEKTVPRGIVKPLCYVFGVVCVLAIVWFAVKSGTKNTLGTVYLEGVVMLDGEPVNGVNVTLHPRSEEGIAAGGISNSRGKFTVTTGTARVGSGAKPGEYDITFYKVEVATLRDAFKYQPAPASRSASDNTTILPLGQKTYIVPERYGSPKTSGLEPINVVQKGKNRFTFELSSADAEQNAAE